MPLVTLRNDFHNTSVTLRCEVLSHIHNECVIYPTAGQLKRARRELCYQKDCTCGKIRGNQTYNGKRLIVDRSSEYESH